MDIRSLDRAQDAYRLANKKSVQQKVMVFVIPDRVRAGLVKAETRFPYSGKIVDVYASCVTAGVTKTEIQIEKCTQADYDTSPVWRNIFSTNLSFDPNSKSTMNSSVPYVLADSTVSENDHFRVNIVSLGDGIEGITLEVVVQI